MKAAAARLAGVCLGLAAALAGPARAASAAESEAPATQVALPDRSELLPAAFDPVSLLGPLPAGVGLVDAHLYRIFPYGPGVYLLVAQASAEGVQVPITLRGTLRTQLSLFLPQQRLWALLLRLPGDRWPAQGAPELLGAVSMPPTCATDPLATDGATPQWSDAGLGDDERVEATLAPWRWLGEPGIALLRSNNLEGSGGGTHYASAWYLAMDARNPEDVRRMLPLLCAPANAGSWSKPSYGPDGEVDEPGGEEELTWTVQPRLEPEYSSLPLLYLLEQDDPSGAGCLRARYVENAAFEGDQGLYLLDRDGSPATTKTDTPAGPFRPCPSRTTTR